MINIRYIVLLLHTLIISTLSAQSLVPRPLPLQKRLDYHPCIDYTANRLVYPADSTTMQHFYSLLDTLSLYGKGDINIVHIGGSHIQADIMSDALRRNFVQCIPGFKASRGIIFPYKAGHTNNPSNYAIQYSGTWRRCQNSLPPIDRVLGVTGIAVSTDDRYATITFSLNTDSARLWHYHRLRLLASVADTALTPVLIIGTDTIAPSAVANHCAPQPDTLSPSSPVLLFTYDMPYQSDFGTIALYPTQRIAVLQAPDSTRLCTALTDTTTTTSDSLMIGLESDNTSIVARHDITFANSIVDDKLFTINGILPETDNDGITYHSLGVNGASLPSWLRCTDFADQLHLLRPDLVIMAIGVNDANVPYGRFCVDDYIANYNALIDMIYAVNPQCAIIFVTNNDCVLRTGRHSHGPNRNTALVADAMIRLALRHNAAVWDMYRIMGGLGSMAVWRDYGLANRDRVHFLAPGYKILGDMLYNAIIYDWLYKN